MKRNAKSNKTQPSKPVAVAVAIQVSAIEKNTVAQKVGTTIDNGVGLVTNGARTAYIEGRNVVTGVFNFIKQANAARAEHRALRLAKES